MWTQIRTWNRHGSVISDVDGEDIFQRAHDLVKYERVYFGYFRSTTSPGAYQEYIKAACHTRMPPCSTTMAPSGRIRNGCRVMFLIQISGEWEIEPLLDSSYKFCSWLVYSFFFCLWLVCSSFAHDWFVQAQRLSLLAVIVSKIGEYLSLLAAIVSLMRE